MVTGNIRSLRKKVVFLIGLCIVCGLALSFALFFPRRPPNVVVVLIDTVRADHLGFFGYERATTPFLDSFARENTRYTACNAAAPWTPASIASIFTSLYPSAHGMMPPNDRGQATRLSTKLEDHFVTLAEAFKSHGYQTAAVITNPWLQESFGYHQGFDFYRYLHRVRATDVNRAAYKLFEETLTPEKQPFFLYLHYMDPHEPYDPPEEYKKLFTGPLKDRRYPDRQVQKIGLYDGELRYTDGKLAKLFTFFRKQSWYEDSVILLLSDHGEQFFERGHQGHGFNLFSEELRVPCLLKYDGKSRTVANPVSLVDFYPTLLELAGIESKETLQGISLIGSLNRRKSSGLLSEVKRVEHSKALIDPQNDKLINVYPAGAELTVDPAAPPERSSVFNSLTDPREEKPLENPAKAQNLQQSFQALYESTLKLRKAPKASEIEIDPITAEELKSLGYL